MATLPSLLACRSSRLVSPLRRASSFGRTFNVSQIRVSPPRCSRLHSPDDSVSTPAAGEQSGRGRVVGLVDSRRAGCVLGLGAVAGTAMALFPAHATAASEIASNWDAWSSLVASEPKNALSLPTWVIHVASVAECRVPRFPSCRALESVFELFGWSREVQSSFRETELTNALSLPTWFIHVASVVEWVTAMVLVWRYGDTPGNSTWKGLSWGMVPLLGGAMCACTWHFFYNAQSLEILVILQAAFTVIGNFTMWIAAFRIYQSSQNQSKAP